MRLLLVVSLGLLASCFDWRGNLLKQASFDMKCPVDKLSTQPLGNDHNQGVRGCGKRATYVAPTNGETWVLNGPVQAE
jgi:hypothetical protein